MNAVIDRVVQYPHRYQLTNTDTGEILGTFDLEPITGTISVVGTKIDKALFDSIASDLSARLVSNGGDAKNNIVTYSMASNRSNVASGEKLSVSFGKIAKYFNDLKAVAFSGNKKDIGLDKVDNTADKDKNVKYAESAGSVAWDNVSGKPTEYPPESHNHNKSEVGLGNVDNTSDANKPVSNATQQALNLKANKSDVYTKTETDGLLNGKANANDVYSKTKTDELLNNKANKSDVYTKSESDAGLNKSLYNLGYYDTITANSDGSYTITRQTGYHNISNDLIEHGYYRTTINGHGEYGSDSGIHNLPILSDTRGDKNFINNLLAISSYDGVYNGLIAISLGDNGKCWMNLGDNYTTKNQYVEYLSKNNIYIQYKLATSYTEKVEKNHYARYNQTFILEHNKNEAERSANLLENTNAQNYDLNFLDDNTTYTLSFNLSGSIGFTLGDGTSTIVDRNLSSGYNSFTFVKKSGGNAFIWFSDTSKVSNLMLNEGSVALPYQPYEGKVVHEKELNTAIDEKTLFTLVGENVDTLTITKNETYFITTLTANKIYVSENEGVSFYGSSIISTISMLSGSPHITINGSAYKLDTNSVTLLTSGMMNVYKKK